MSGGRFDYKQHNIREIYESIEEYLYRQGKPKAKNDLWFDSEHYLEYPEEKYYETYPTEIQKAMQDAIDVLKKAYVYAHRIDWFLSGDDVEESFLSRLNDELNNL